MASHDRQSARFGLWQTFALCMTDTVGVGPFVTLPLMVAAMGGSPAMLAWVAGAVISGCDALVWSELASSFPRAGGTYVYLQEIFPGQAGRALSFIYVAQLLVSAPLSMASACLGVGKYVGYLLPAVGSAGWGGEYFEATGANLAAAIAAVLAIVLVYRRVQAIGRAAIVLLACLLATFALILVAGVTHFHAGLVRQSLPGAWGWSSLKVTLGGGLLLALYDYWGYYNAALLGDEVRDPQRNIPRAMLLAIGVVTALYLSFSICVLGVLPWQEVASAGQLRQLNVASVMMERCWGPWAGDAIAVLIMITAFAGAFAVLTGYSRVLFAAARDGNLPEALGRLHPRGEFPGNAVLLIGGVTVLFCFVPLAHVIAAMVILRLVMQFGVQTAGLLWLRASRPEVRRPFRMWLYPLPALVALAGFALVLTDKAALLARAGLFAAMLLAIYVGREVWRRQAA